MRVASYTKIDLKIEFSGSKNPLGTLRIAIKALKRVKILSCVCACSHRKRALRLEEPPKYSPIGVKSFEMRKNPLLRMRVASKTKIDLKIEFNGSKNPLCDLWHKSYMTMYESYTSHFTRLKLCSQRHHTKRPGWDVLTRRAEIGRSCSHPTICY